jgi:hypothetical protein
LAGTRKSALRPAVIFLIGIILIALSFTLWYYIVPPVVGLSTYSIAPPSASKTIDNASSLTLYFGYLYVSPADVYNRSRPVDYSFNLSMRISANVGQLIDVTVYVRGKPLFNAKTSATVETIYCNTTQLEENQTAPKGVSVFPNVESPISVSLTDAFTGGTTPYMIIQNLNTTRASVTYSYDYTAKFRNSDGLPLAMFIVGVIIAVIEGIGLLRFAIARVRER